MNVNFIYKLECAIFFLKKNENLDKEKKKSSIIEFSVLIFMKGSFINKKLASLRKKNKGKHGKKNIKENKRFATRMKRDAFKIFSINYTDARFGSELGLNGTKWDTSI